MLFLTACGSIDWRRRGSSNNGAECIRRVISKRLNKTRPSQHEFAAGKHARRRRRKIQSLGTGVAQSKVSTLQGVVGCKQAKQARKKLFSTSDYSLRPHDPDVSVDHVAMACIVAPRRLLKHTRPVSLCVSLEESTP